MIINLSNQLTQLPGIQLSYVASAGTAGGTQLGVKNIDGLTQNWAVQIGHTGDETAEIMLISGAPSGTVLNFGTSPSHSSGTLLFAHAQDTPMYQIHYDQVVFYRSTAGTGGPFSALATVSLQPDSLTTQYNDATGAASYAYYAQYYNSVTTDLSGSSSIFTPGGPTYYSLQKIRQRVRDKVFSSGYVKDDSIITDWINEWVENMTNAAIKVNQNYMLGTVQYAFGTSGLGTVTASDYKQPIKVEVTYDGVTFIPSIKMEVRAYSETDYFDITKPRHVWIGETVFEILPHNQAGSAKITYAQRFTPLVNDTDELTQTLKAYTTSATEYCLGVAYALDQKDADAQLHYQLFGEGKKDFIEEITPRDLTGAETIDITESVSGLEDDLANDMGDYVW